MCKCEMFICNTEMQIKQIEFSLISYRKLKEKRKL